MPTMIDARVPVRLDTVEGAAAAWLVQDGGLTCAAPVQAGSVQEFFVVTPVHLPGCACCLPRGAVAAALHRLFLRRAKGEVPFFDYVNVQADAAGQAAVVAALAEDGFVSARFRAA